MGGRGSGKPSGFGLTVDLVEDQRRIDLAQFKRWGTLNEGTSGQITWSTRGKTVATIRYVVGQDGMRLIYRIRETGSSDWRDVDDFIPFAYTDANFGGQRRWFVCPACQKRCRVLFGGGLFRCRDCQDLRYESQYEPGFARATAQAHQLRTRLGQSGPLDAPFPPKPKGMHWQTYRRLETKDKEFQRRWIAGVSAWLDR